MDFPPLDEELYLGKHVWSPETVKQMVKQGTEIASYRRVAASFEEMTKIGVSKSSMERLAKEYGSKVVKKQEEEAESMVKPPKKEEVITKREMPVPDSEVMALSMDGAMVYIVGEGWKEVKTVAVSALKKTIDEESGEIETKLTAHSYRAGLWEAKEFAKQQWAEGYQRGLERAKQVVSVNDGALWIWLIVQMCWAPCVEILDWWHVVEKLWELAQTLFAAQPNATDDWVKTQKSHLYNGKIRSIIRAIRQLCPRGYILPDKVRLIVAYLFNHRHRLKYDQFRQAGYPIGSDTVESACKVVMQSRMKQAGMRWSRDGAQAMLALRSTLLSDRWDDVWASFRPS